MYNWPTEVVPSVFEGLVVETICFSSNTISINFDRDHSITLESSAQLKIGQRQVAVRIPPSSADILHLLGKVVTGSAVDEDGTSLVLDFDDAQLRLDGSDDSYECFHLSIGGKDFIV